MNLQRKFIPCFSVSKLAGANLSQEVVKIVWLRLFLSDVSANAEKKLVFC